jgi:hypothetical protein
MPIGRICRLLKNIKEQIGKRKGERVEIPNYKSQITNNI